MKTVTLEKYQCEICGHEYDKQSEAEKCEAKPVSQDKGVKVGDVVLIVGGEGQGSKATVDSRFVVNMYWGHYMWERYWHTVSITANLIDSTGFRILTFDDYELIPK